MVKNRPFGSPFDRYGRRTPLRPNLRTGDRTTSADNRTCSSSPPDRHGDANFLLQDGRSEVAHAFQKRFGDFKALGYQYSADRGTQVVLEHHSKGDTVDSDLIDFFGAGAAALQGLESVDERGVVTRLIGANAYDRLGSRKPAGGVRIVFKSKAQDSGAGLARFFRRLIVWALARTQDFHDRVETRNMPQELLRDLGCGVRLSAFLAAQTLAIVELFSEFGWQRYIANLRQHRGRLELPESLHARNRGKFCGDARHAGGTTEGRRLCQGEH